MRPIRIHIGHMPPLLCTMINDLLREEADFVVVGSSGPGDDPLCLADRQQADLLITEQREVSGSSTLDALIHHAPLSIFAIAADGRGATAINMVRTLISLEAIEQGTLARAIRSLVAQTEKRHVAN